MALPKGTMTSQLKNPAVKKIYIYLQQHINTVSLISMYKFELSRFLQMWQELMNCSSKAVKSPFILIPMRLHCSVWKIHSNKITMRWLFLFRIPLYITRDYIQYVLSTCSWRVHRNYISMFDNISDVKWQLQEPREWFIHRIGKIASHEAMQHLILQVFEFEVYLLGRKNENSKVCKINRSVTRRFLRHGFRNMHGYLHIE